MDFTPETMVPFTPRLIPAILPNLAHHIPDIQSAAIETNQMLFSLIQSLPAPAPTNITSPPPSISGRDSVAQNISSSSSLRAIPASPPTQSAATTPNARQAFPTSVQNVKDGSSSNSSLASKEDLSTDSSTLPDKNTSTTPTQKARTLTSSSDAGGATPTPATVQLNGGPSASTAASESRSQSPAQSIAIPTGIAAPMQQSPVSTAPPIDEMDPFDYQATVNSLTIQFLSEHEETRVASLKWLIMLHQKAPKKVLEYSMNGGVWS